MSEQTTEEIVELLITDMEASYADGAMECLKPPSAVDIKIAEIFKSFACFKDCCISTEEQPKDLVVSMMADFSSTKLTVALRDSDTFENHLEWPRIFLSNRNAPLYRSHRLRLHGGALYLDVALIITALFRQAEIIAKKRNTPAPATLKALCANFPKKPFGGLRFEYRNIYISPLHSSCLLKSFSVWQYFFATGKMTEKHGLPGVITIQGDNFLIEDWYTVENQGEVVWEHIAMAVQCTRAQLKVAFEKAQQDVRDFLIPLRSWAMRYYPEDAEKLVACFTKAFVDRVNNPNS